MKRAVGQARRAVEALVAATEEKRPDDELEPLITAAVAKLDQLGGLWETAQERSGVEITTRANGVAERYRGCTAETFSAKRDSANELAELRGFVRDCNRLFPDN